MLLLAPIGLSIWLLTGESLGEAGRQLRRFTWFFFVMMVVPLIFYPGVPIVIFENAVLPISYEGVNASLLAGTKLATMFLISLSFMKTTPAEEIHATLGHWIVAFKLKGSILEEGTKVFILAWEIFPQLLTELQREFNERKDVINNSLQNPFKRAINIGFQIIPVLVHILKNPPLAPKKRDNI